MLIELNKPFHKIKRFLNEKPSGNDLLSQVVHLFVESDPKKSFEGPIQLQYYL